MPISAMHLASQPCYGRSSRQASQLQSEHGRRDKVSADNIRSLTRQGDRGITTFHTLRQKLPACHSQKGVLPCATNVYI